MIAAIHQPNYLPYLGFFHKMAHCDVFILLDTVEFVDDMYQQRNRVKTPQGWAWLTVPVQHGGDTKPRILEVEIAARARGHWARKHWRTLQMNYSRAPFFRQYAPALEDLYLGQEWTRLCEVNEALIRFAADALGLAVPLVKSSALPASGCRTELLVNLCRAVGADVYLSGKSGDHYLEKEQFPVAGVELRIQEFQHPVYPQSFGPFLPHMCVFDLLFHCGPKSREVLLSRRPAAGPVLQDAEALCAAACG